MAAASGCRGQARPSENAVTRTDGEAPDNGKQMPGNQDNAIADRPGAGQSTSFAIVSCVFLPLRVRPSPC